MTGLELILTKADIKNIKVPLLDFLRGFYLESKGQSNQAVSIYEKCAQDSDNDTFSKISNFFIERIKNE